MRKLFPGFCLLLLTGIAAVSMQVATPTPVSAGDCAMVSTYAEMAFVNFKKAYQAETIEQAQPLIDKGVEQATLASAYAINTECNCDQAKNYALNAVTFGKKARKATDLDDLRKNARKAMNMALDVLTAIPGCK